MINGSFGELVRHCRGSRIQVERKEDREGEERKGEEETAASSLDEEELGGVSTTMEGDLATRGMPDGEELGRDGGGSRQSAVIAAELEEDKDEDTCHGADGRYVYQILNVTVPCRVEVVVAGGRRDRGGINGN